MIIQKTFSIRNLPNVIDKPVSVLGFSNSNGGSSKEYNVMWDTGGGLTSIRQSVVNELGLQPSPYPVIGRYANGEQKQQTTYFLNVIDNQTKKPTTIIATVLENPSFEIVIGMDFISLGEFMIKNIDNSSYRFEFKL